MRVQLKISFKEQTSAELTFKEGYLPQQLNVAVVDDDIQRGVFKGARGFQLSSKSRLYTVSKLDGKSTAFPSRGYRGIITSALSATDKLCDVDISFTLNGKTPEYLYLEFDSIANEYAVNFSIVTDYNTYGLVYNNNTQVFLAIPLSKLYLPSALQDVTFTLKIRKWSKSLSSIKITRLSPYYVATYTERDIISTDNSENFLDAQVQITPGICEQYIEAEIYDRTGSLRGFAKTNALTDDHNVEIVAVDGDVTYDMGAYVISSWDLNSTSSVVKLSGRDKSYLLEKINIPRSPVQLRNLDMLLTTLFSYADGFAWRYQDNETRERCKSIVIPNNWYLASDLRTMLNKICAVGMLRIYWYIDAFIVGRCC